MKSYLLLMLLAGAAVQGARVKQRLQKTIESVNMAQTSVSHSCSYSISRWKNNIVDDYVSIIGSGVKYTDANFPTSDAITWSDYTTNTLTSFVTSISYKIIINRVPSATLFGTNGPSTSDIVQGNLGDCYYLAACSATAENSLRISNSFIQSSYPSEGIFAIKVYVRGILTTLTIDDYIPFLSATSSTPVFA